MIKASKRRGKKQIMDEDTFRHRLSLSLIRDVSSSTEARG